LIGAGSLVKLAREFSQFPQVLVFDILLAFLEYWDAALLSANPFDLAFEAGVEVDGPVVKPLSTMRRYSIRGRSGLRPRFFRP
jgi:hypothetical protein